MRRNTDSGAGRQRPVDVPIDPPPPFDGRFTFARLKFTTAAGGYYFRGLPAWAHGYVGGGEGRRSERNLAKILNSITNMNPHVDATRVVDVGDPDLFQYPVVYATEAGFMELDDREAHALGDYLRKGGFVIFDDFRGEADWENFRSTMQRVLPGEQPTELPLSHPIFHAFFDIQTLQFVQYYDRGTPIFYGMFENNDQSKPLQLIANFNNDVSEYLGILGHRLHADRPVERSLQARGQLRRLRDDALTRDEMGHYRPPRPRPFGVSAASKLTRWPSISTSLIVVFSANRSPSVMMTLAILPFSSDPRRSATPAIVRRPASARGPRRPPAGPP